MNINLYPAYSFHQQGGRQYQEDARYPDIDSAEQGQRFFIVCDGVGGSEHGEVASKMVCETFAKALSRTDFSQPFTTQMFSKALDAAYDALDKYVRDGGSDDMATTLTFVAFHADGVMMAHCGDSRIYQIRPGKGIIYKSDDHSMVNQWVHAGILTPEQAVNHPKSNIITRCLQPVKSDENRSLCTVAATCDIQTGDYFLLCSDGVIHNADDDTIVTLLSDSSKTDEQKTKELAAISASSSDNNTAYVIHVAQVATDENATVPDASPSKATVPDGSPSGIERSTKRNPALRITIEDIESIQKPYKESFMKKIMRRLFSLAVTIAITGIMTPLSSYAQDPTEGVVVETDDNSIIDSIDVTDNATPADTIAAEETLTIQEAMRKGLQLMNSGNPTEAAQWFEYAAGQGSVPATYYCGLLRFRGMGMPQDKKEGLNLLMKAAEQGMPAAQLLVGKAYYDGDGIEQNYIRAAELFQKAAPYNGDAQWMLGQCYLNGKGVARNYHFATQWLVEPYKAKKKEFGELLLNDNEGPFSQYLMGLRKYYIDKDYNCAMECFKKAGKGDIEGLTMQGVCLATKDNPNRDLKKAAEILTEASKNSDAAKYYLSTLYAEGLGVDKDEEKALELLQKAAEGGIAYAQCRLADRLFLGNGVPQDSVRAARLYLMAEQQHHLTQKGASNLAECYRNGTEGLPDIENAEQRISQLNKITDNKKLTEVLKALKN